MAENSNRVEPTIVKAGKQAGRKMPDLVCPRKEGSSAAGEKPSGKEPPFTTVPKAGVWLEPHSSPEPTHGEAPDLEALWPPTSPRKNSRKQTDS